MSEDTKARIIKEYGCQYTHEIKKEYPEHWKVYAYEWEYLVNNRKGLEKVACRSPRDFEQLYACWTRRGGKHWKYKKIGLLENEGITKK